MRQKLFTKQIDDMLFKQYAMGNDLSKQKVVAKIFNPYGRGTYYLLNSDPSDPDYIWAIVDLFEVEVGSVSRESLETMKVPPFGLNLERDIYFQPINASELLSRLYQGETFANGGKVNGYKIYHDTLAQALEEVEDFFHNEGYLFTSDNYFPDVTVGGIGYGETARITRPIQLQGKSKGGVANIQIYRMDSGKYELNMYPSYADGGEMDSMSYARTKGKESIDWDKELREYAGSNYSKLSEREKEEIISDMQKDYDRNYFADGGELEIIKNESGENYLTSVNSTPNEMAVKLAKGGGIPNNYRGRTTEDIWNSLTEDQRVHFMFDHFDELGVKESEIVRIANKEFQDLNEDVKGAFKTHTMMGQYADGGMSDEKLYKVVGKKNGQLVEISEMPMTYEDSKKFIKEQGVQNYYQNVDIVSYHGNKPRYKYADGGEIKFDKEFTNQQLWDFTEKYGNSIYSINGKIVSDKNKGWSDTEYSPRDFFDLLKNSGVLVGFIDKKPIKYYKVSMPSNPNVTFNIADYSNFKKSDFLASIKKAYEKKAIDYSEYIKYENLIENNDFKFLPISDFINKKMADGGGVNAFKKGDKVVLKFDIENRKGNEEVLEVVGFDNDKLILENRNKVGKSRKVQMRSYVYPNDVVLQSKMGMGGKTENIEVILEKVNSDELKQFPATRNRLMDIVGKLRKCQILSENDIETLKMNNVYYKMAKGGKTTFNDKAKAISKSLLKRKKVAPSVQKDYGKTYDKKEAVESAKRIVGAMRKKTKMSKGGRTETQEHKGITYNLGDKFTLGYNTSSRPSIEVSIVEILPSGLFFKVDKSTKVFSIKTLNSKGSTVTHGEYLIPKKKS